MTMILGLLLLLLEGGNSASKAYSATKSPAENRVVVLLVREVFEDVEGILVADVLVDLIDLDEFDVPRRLLLLICCLLLLRRILLRRRSPLDYGSLVDAAAVDLLVARLLRLRLCCC